MRQQKMEQNIQIAKPICVATRDSKKCQDFYKTLDEEDQKKKLTCSDEEIKANVNGNYLGEAALACAAGIIVDPVVALGEAIGEGAAKMQIAWEKAAECNKSVEQKMALVHAFNMDVPKMMQFKMPPMGTLQRIPCKDLNEAMQAKKRHVQRNFNDIYQRYKSNPTSLNEDEKELLDYHRKLSDDLQSKRQGNIAKMVEEMIKDMNLSLECYSPAQALAIRCEIAATIGSMFVPGLLALRVARLSKLTKVRAEKIQKHLDELRGMSREERIAKAKTEIAPLDDGEKLRKLESELGRSNKPLNDRERAAYEKAHLEGSDRGEAYGTYTGNTLRDKKRILMQEGGFSEREADFMINRGYVGNAGPDKVMDNIKEHSSWGFLSGGIKNQGKKIFGRELNDDQAASIISYRNALVSSSNREANLEAAVARMRAQGLTEAEIKHVVSRDFENGVPMASTRPTATTASKPAAPPAAAPTPPPAAPPAATPTQARAPSASPTPQNNYLAQVESNFKNDPVYHSTGKELKPKEAQSVIDQAARTKFRDDNDRAGYVMDSFREDIQHLQRLRSKAESATGVEKEKINANIQVYSKRCKNWASLYNQAGYSNMNFQSETKRDISRYCQ